MGVIIPQVVTSDRASGAQVIDGSLKFDASKSQYLTRTPGSAGNRKTWTWSCWLRRDNLGSIRTLFSVDNTENFIRFQSDAFHFYDQSQNKLTSTLFRDSSGWYNLVLAVDYTASAADMVKGYINGSLVTWGSVDNTFSDTNGGFNDTTAHEIGRDADGDNDPFDGSMSQVYFIDGQQLDVSYFGYTDGLTNTWKPKKYEGDFGTNGFYLPFDGSAPIGQDQSGNGNDWTPVNFGGSVALDSPLVSGARPILNTTQGGTQAGVGVFGSKQNVGYAVTVYDDGGGNKYYIDGVKQDTVTGLIRGATYTFDTSDSTVSSHPFRFSATSNGSHGGGSEYTNGVAAITGAATTITVPYDAPNTLYYYCTSHSGMGADITGITTNEKLADQYASHCVLALPLVNSVNDVSTSIACTSTTKTVTRYNATATNESSNFYAGSYYFDGTSDKLKSTTAPEFVFGTSDFTVEAWVYKIDSTNALFLGQTDNDAGGRKGIAMGWHGGQFWLLQGNGSSWSIETQVGSFPRNKWVHIAASRDYSATKTYYFVDGQLVYTYTSNVDLSADTNNHLTIGSIDTDSLDWDGYIQDFRIYRGVAKYTSNFVVPSRSPDILPDTPSGVSGSSKLTKITDGAVSFDGTGDFLGLANSTDTNFGSGDFTVECFAYFTDVTAETLLGQWENGSDRRSWLLQVNSGQLNCYLSADGTTSGQKRIDSASGAISTNRWYHLAYARSGDTMRLFIDGEQVGSVDVDGFTNYANTNDGFQVGSQTASGSNLMNGFISNARIIKGTGIYTSNFKAPTEPLTNVTNTVLLCCQSNTSATEGAVKPGTITANGDAAANTFNPFNTDINTVRGQETGYATLNPLSVSGSGGTRTSSTLSNGNLTSTNPGSDAWNCRLATVGVDSGKWYYEYTVNGSISNFLGGWADSPNLNWGDAVGNTSRSYGYYNTGNVRNSNNNTSFGATYTVGDVVGCAIDLDNYKIYWSKNGVWQNDAVPAAGTGSIYTVASGYQYFPAVSTYDSNSSVTVNFGQNPFSFLPPDGFQPLNGANLIPETVIVRPDQYVGIVTYTGTGSAFDINYNFSPDFAWVKGRSYNSSNHQLSDTVRNRAAGGNRRLELPGTAVQDAGGPGFINSGLNINTNAALNTSDEDYVAWAWKAGGNKNTFNVDDVGYATAAAAGLTGGDITPTGASVGTKQGFSIIQFTGSGSGTPSIPHGLSEAPTFILQKDTGATTSWRTFLYNISTWSIMNINNQDGATGATETAPTSSLFYANGNGNAANTQIAYLWHDVPGLQKFGSFEGNGNADGPFVELGFRPSLLLVRNIDNSGTGYSWSLYDNERGPINPNFNFLCPDSSNKENRREGDTVDKTDRYIDFLSNGFKMRADNANFNATSHTIFYAAWAEAPSVNLYGGGANAR